MNSFNELFRIEQVLPRRTLLAKFRGRFGKLFTG